MNKSTEKNLLLNIPNLSKNIQIQVIINDKKDGIWSPDLNPFSIYVVLK